MKTKQALSFFTGAMGLDLGVEAAGYEIITACEIPTNYRKPHQSRPKARDTIKLNRPGLFVYEGIESYDFPRSHVGIDLIFGGPCCQSFSVAGKRKGADSYKGQLLFEFARLIDRQRPKAFILENVPGLLSANEGQAFKDLLEILSTYRIRINAVNAADFGLAQNRKRIILVGALAGLPAKMCGTGERKNLRDAIAHLEDDTGAHILPSPCVLEAVKRGESKRLSWDTPTPTLLTRPGSSRRSPLMHPDIDRILTVCECKILQGFPVDWPLAGSVREQYEQVGNAAPVPFGYSAAMSLKNILEK